MTLTDIAFAAAAVALGGLLKGATGAGAPVVGVPILAMLFDVPTAVAIFVIPNLFSNIWQGWQYRASQVSRRFTWGFALAGGAGAGLGSVMLATLPQQALMGGLAAVVLMYIGFRLLRPDWKLASGAADRLVMPVGFVGGVMQGAGGISAPVSVTFLNAIRLDRAAFIATISVFFMIMSVVQIPLLASFGILTPHRAALSLAAMVPLFLAMPVGARLTRHVSKATFDRMILVLLTVIALKLVWDALA